MQVKLHKETSLNFFIHYQLHKEENVNSNYLLKAASKSVSLL
jgi:hypothetical protein